MRWNWCIVAAVGSAVSSRRNLIIHIRIADLPHLIYWARDCAKEETEGVVWLCEIPINTNLRDEAWLWDIWFFFSFSSNVLISNRTYTDLLIVLTRKWQQFYYFFFYLSRFVILMNFVYFIWFILDKRLRCSKYVHCNGLVTDFQKA